MEKPRLSDLQARADAMGLTVCKYNPGDGTNYKITRDGLDYFQTDGLYRSKHLAEIGAFLAGYSCHRNDLPNINNDCDAKRA